MREEFMMATTEMASPMSPRRLPLWKDKATVSILGYDDKERQAAGQRYGAKPREVYGFVGAISSVIGTVVYMIWAFLPDPWLHTVGFTYYPDRFWAVAIPAYMLVALVFTCLVYTSLCYLATLPPDSLFTLSDEHTREALVSSIPGSSVEDEPIHPISDMPITHINWLMFGRQRTLSDKDMRALCMATNT